MLWNYALVRRFASATGRTDGSRCWWLELTQQINRGPATSPPARHGKVISGIGRQSRQPTSRAERSGEASWKLDAEGKWCYSSRWSTCRHARALARVHQSFSPSSRVASRTPNLPPTTCRRRRLSPQPHSDCRSVHSPTAAAAGVLASGGSARE